MEESNLGIEGVEGGVSGRRSNCLVFGDAGKSRAGVGRGRVRGLCKIMRVRRMVTPRVGEV